MSPEKYVPPDQRFQTFIQIFSELMFTFVIYLCYCEDEMTTKAFMHAANIRPTTTNLWSGSLACGVEAYQLPKQEDHDW
jgi:hypothetical protein